MARGKKKESNLAPEEKLAQALVPDWEQPYQVPRNWCWTKIGMILSLQAGKNISAKDISPEKIEKKVYPCFGGNGIRGYVEHCSHKGEYPIIGRQGALCGNLNWACGDFYATEHAVVVTCPDGVHKKWAFYCLHDMNLNQYATSVAQPGLAVGTINQVPIALPPSHEQQRIVDRIEYLFAKLDEAKEKAQSVLDSFETRKAAILHKAFTGELTAKWRNDHCVDLDNWNQGCLSDFCEVNPKKVATKNLSDDLDVSFVPMPAVSDVLGEITDPQIRKLKEVRTGFTNFSEGDVVFAKITPCMENGKSAVVGSLVNGIGFGTTEFYVLRCTNLLYNRYLYHLVRSRSFRAEAKAVMTGAVGQQRVPKSFLEEYTIMLPSIPEQNEIVRILDNLLAKEQAAKEAAEAVLEKIDLLKKSILARAFRGELGTNDPTEESAIELLKEVLQKDNTPAPRKRAKSMPRELQAKLATALERNIIKMYFQQETDSLPAGELLSIGTNKFEIMETLRNLEQSGIIKKLSNGNYRLLW